MLNGGEITFRTVTKVFVSNASDEPPPQKESRLQVLMKTLPLNCAKCRLSLAVTAQVTFRISDSRRQQLGHTYQQSPDVYWLYLCLERPAVICQGSSHHAAVLPRTQENIVSGVIS